MKSFLSILICLCSCIMYGQTSQLSIDGVPGEHSINVLGGQTGLNITGTIGDGIYLGGIGQNGINLFNTTDRGLNIVQTGDDGIYMFNLNGHGINLGETLQDGIRVVDAGDHAGFLANKSTSNFPTLKLQAGSDSKMDLGFSGHARIESDGSFVYYLDKNANSSSDRLVVVNSNLEDVFDVNEVGDAIIKNKLSISNSTGQAIRIDDAGDDGVVIVNSFDSGLNVFGAGGHGGYFQTSTSSTEPAIEAVAGDDSNIDLKLGAHGKMSAGGNLEIFLDDNDNGNNKFAIHKSNSIPLGSEIFTVNESGQTGVFGTLAVGLVQNTPAGYSLSVDGKVIAEEVVVQLSTDWPDYVFKANYQLRSLEETAAFIDEKGHLPGIPSAVEVQENGIAVGDMQKRMMEKIEELTLHVIRLNDENNALKARLDSIENK